MDDPQGNEQLSFSRRQFLHGAGAMTAGLVLRGAPGLGLGRVALPRGQSQTAVDVTAAPYRARGDGQTNDRAAFQAAIDAAIQQRRPLWIPRPAAFYRIELDNANPQLDVAGNLAIVGAGRESTLLRVSVAAPQAGHAYHTFYIHNGVHFQAAELRLEEDVDLNGYALHGFFFEAGPADHPCLIEAVDVDGFTHVAAAGSSGPEGGRGELFLAIRDCDFKPQTECCVAFWSAEDGHKRLHVYDSYFHGSRDNHLVYCHPHNTVHVENTRFDDTPNWAFHLQGTAISGDPEYQRLIGCWFGPHIGRSVITHGGPTTHPRPEIINCLFESSNAIQIRSDVLIDGCYFTNARDAQSNSAFVAAIENEPWEMTMRNCIFAPKRDVLPYIDLRLAGVTATIANCQFYHQGSGSILALGKTAANVSMVNNCLFYIRPDNGSQAISIEVEDGQTTIANCRFHGRAPGDRAIIYCKRTNGTLSDTAALRVDGCTFQSVTGGGLFYIDDGPGNSWRGRVAGDNNRIHNWQSASPMLVVNAPQAPFYARLSPVPGPAPLALAAAPALVISSNYDAYQVSGGGDVAALHWWSDDGTADPLFSGAISLTAASPFALVGGGNIQLAGGAARRDVAAGATVRLSYDSAVGRWSEEQ
jgi:hypothetical protein